ncbi:MAG: hypothetical protein JZU53_08770 [Paludibacter sp.]|nr:hypothetical protein [Paludibacter sp.]
MSARILTNTPTSGEFPEFYFGEHFRKSLWVEFVDKKYEKWIGCFECNYPNVLNEVLVDKDNKSAFVVSGGIGYLIDIENRKLKYKTEENPLIESVILTTNPDFFIAGTFYCVYIFDNEKLIKEVLADDLVDGIYFKRQVDRKAAGDLASIENQFEFNLDFELDLDTFELTVDRSVITKHNDTVKKTKQDEKNSETKQSIFRRLINKLK